YLLVRPVLRNKYRDRLSNYLFFGITEYLLSPFIPTGDDAIEVFTDDGIIRRFHDTRKVRLPGLLFVLIDHVYNMGSGTVDDRPPTYYLRINQNLSAGAVGPFNNHFRRAFGPLFRKGFIQWE